jgi:transposase
VIRSRVAHCVALYRAPHRWRRFKLSNDPAFAEKLHAVVGLYVAPPAHAVVLSLDEKSQIQALDRTQPGLPLKKGRGATMTHDYKRNGTTTLFAALNVLTGEVFGRNMQRHRHQEFIRFLNALERDIPAGKVVHVILDNYAAHKHAKVRAWLERHPRWTFHFTPTSSSWLNAVEGFFAKLTRRRLKHGVFRSVVDLQAAINRFVAEHNEKPQSPSSGAPTPTPGGRSAARWMGGRGRRARRLRMPRRSRTGATSRRTGGSISRRCMTGSAGSMATRAA